ncbi:hypothetical protein J2T16_005344 [Paenibacillus intestini]|uniref:Uncharacterized protein n=1 Tax=Paenibacillus cucumis (ex Kampfer et al. 2016) TaxID=1776858 RepID=A0ABS7KKR7_9BACL|nr:hypothetical protein [Paenibacillus cucumis (ex Kampfer et al. 2016)]MBY0204727.1 hypothetical protein [Paenibacillus cucumis (ex Kampfer et al. 2016)]MDP9702367.1 hypothetical protein [Paenibacillus intestini]
MEKLMEVGDVFESNGNGTVIVGNEPVLTAIEKIGDDIVLQISEHEMLNLRVVSVQISNSPNDKKMVGICLGNSINPADIPIGSTVYVF